MLCGASAAAGGVLAAPGDMPAPEGDIPSVLDLAPDPLPVLGDMAPKPLSDRRLLRGEPAFDSGVPTAPRRDGDVVSSSKSSFTHIAAHATSSFSLTTASNAGRSLEADGVESATDCSARTAPIDLDRTVSTESVENSLASAMDVVLLVAQLSAPSSSRPSPLRDFMPGTFSAGKCDSADFSTSAGEAHEATAAKYAARQASALAFGNSDLDALRRLNRGTGGFRGDRGDLRGLIDSSPAAGLRSRSSPSAHPTRAFRPMSLSDSIKAQSERVQFMTGGAEHPRFSAVLYCLRPVNSAISAPWPDIGIPDIASMRVRPTLPTGSGEGRRFPPAREMSAPMPCKGKPCNVWIFVRPTLPAPSAAPGARRLPAAHVTSMAPRGNPTSDSIFVTPGPHGTCSAERAVCGNETEDDRM
mmetsp:Transcript_3961/g.11035  ORF Transcript_3961/g.11035 Transcript_3961/m.11035 type:complete len:414 (+) Transcript_3961:1270-2511(+)